MKTNPILIALLISSIFTPNLNLFAQDQIIFENAPAHNTSSESSNEIDLTKSIAPETNLEGDSDILFVQPSHESFGIDSWMRLVQSRNVDYEAIEQRLENGQNVNKPVVDGNTMLTLGAMQNNIDKIKLALKYNADTHIVNKSGDLALHWAVTHKNLDMVKLLLTASNNNVAKSTNKKIKKTILDVNVQNKIGRTPLHFAALYRSNPENIELLINNQADPNIVDINGQTPSHFAAVSRQWDNLEMLIKKGANIFIKDNNGLTTEDMILQYADTSTMIRLYRYLSLEQKNNLKSILSNYNVNLENPENFTPHPKVKESLVIPASTKNIKTYIE